MQCFKIVSRRHFLRSRAARLKTGLPCGDMRAVHCNGVQSMARHCFAIVFSMERVAFTITSSSQAAWLKLCVRMMRPVDRRVADASRGSCSTIVSVIAETCFVPRRCLCEAGATALRASGVPCSCYCGEMGQPSNNRQPKVVIFAVSPCVAAKNLASSLRTVLLSQLAVCPAPEDGVESGARSGGRRCLAPGRRPDEQLHEMPQWRSEGCPSREWFASARGGSAADEESASAGDADEDATRWARDR